MELLVSDENFTSAPRWLLVHALLVFGFLYLPIAILILYSFNGEGVGGFPPHHLTLEWYRTLFADGPIWDSVLNSLQVAFAWRFRSPSECRRRWRWSARSFPARHCSGDWCCCR
jgi:ABC-type sugar transport system permease subunit